MQSICNQHGKFAYFLSHQMHSFDLFQSKIKQNEWVICSNVVDLKKYASVLLAFNKTEATFFSYFEFHLGRFCTIEFLRNLIHKELDTKISSSGIFFKWHFFLNDIFFKRNFALIDEDEVHGFDIISSNCNGLKKQRKMSSIQITEIKNSSEQVFRMQ